MTDDKFILDACCGGKMFWFNKNHPNALYIDIRKEDKGFIKHRLSYEVQPDIVMDFRDLKFPDGKFNLVVFDPPHLIKLGKTSWMGKKYGILSDSWKQDISKGFSECWRVLDDKGILIFKWGERDIPLSEILKLAPATPLFGHTTNQQTHWLCFMKIQGTEKPKLEV